MWLAGGRAVSVWWGAGGPASALMLRLLLPLHVRNCAAQRAVVGACSRAAGVQTQCKVCAVQWLTGPVQSLTRRTLSHAHVF